MLEFARTRVSVVGEFGRPQFSPRIVIRMQDGGVFDAEYPYERMKWGFEDLVARLEDTAPGYPLGRASFDALVAATKSAEGLESVAPLLELVLRDAS